MHLESSTPQQDHLVAASEPQLSRPRYLLPDFFFAAQYAFNLADRRAFADALVAFFATLLGGLAERVDLARRNLAHLAF